MRLVQRHCGCDRGPESCSFAYEHVQFPLEAINLLQDPWKPITCLVIPPTLKWFEFSVFISKEHHHLRRVLITESCSPADGALAMGHHIVDGALRQPWHPGGLYEALGLSLSEARCLSCQARLANDMDSFCQTCITRSTDLSELDDLGGLG